MMDEIINKHNYWVSIAKSFGAGSYSEDFVQDAYIKVIGRENINIGYFYLTLFTTVMDSKRKRQIQTIEIQDDIDTIEEVEDFNEDITNILQFIDTWHWYDKRIYLEYIEEKTSFRKFAKKYNYDYQVIFRTITKCNKMLFEYGKKRI